MVMGSQRGVMEDPKSQTLPRQGSLYSLTLGEVQTHLASSGKPLGSMNLDELLKSVWSAEANQSPVNVPAQGLSRQGSLTLPGELSKKTVDEVWREIQQSKRGGSAQERKDKRQKQSTTLGEMTLEDLLLKAGVVTETIPDPNEAGNGGSCPTGLGQHIPQHGPWLQYQAFMPYPVSEMQAMMGGLSDTQAPGRNRVASGDVVGKTVERRQKRMIKNRESAARSRARKQAYTHELEIKVLQLEEENKRLRRQKEVEKVLPSAPPPPDPKRQLQRTSSAPF
ncbi:PREDICTED: ABSCISIC ACID-INSENSITIVE 5-like protein 2 isoform X1 [Tarenaya hassleriana]|uniref:ABSCISIC ACID-INSENSITIVE 5-like protein 2 isoform X1 n=1 Tax=Tarenaya hassleriana TaxID=28532 RepID=UPI00053C364B|nr:PREDICTED: ABSCISIC ACID-INSENSITIVE 5-like protein 2 isoform X1 [Tarenaya hassleriana]XP_019056828.1 PREDICTED: ABSCISIC ACID-INSENSITIVE 5-like protein 2 isoform X1 [Tarenaya hassleriana]